MALTIDQIEKLRRTRPVNGSRVQAAMDLLDLTQAETAAETGLTQPYISDVARGRYPDIHLSNARTLANFFGCSLDVLFPARQRDRVSA